MRRGKRRRRRRDGPVGKNCVFFSYRDGKAVCGLRPGEPCLKSGSCGYEEAGRTVGGLMEKLGGNGR